MGELTTKDLAKMMPGEAARRIDAYTKRLTETKRRLMCIRSRLEEGIAGPVKDRKAAMERARDMAEASIVALEEEI